MKQKQNWTQHSMRWTNLTTNNTRTMKRFIALAVLLVFCVTGMSAQEEKKKTIEDHRKEMREKSLDQKDELIRKSEEHIKMKEEANQKEKEAIRREKLTPEERKKMEREEALMDEETETKVKQKEKVQKVGIQKRHTRSRDENINEAGRSVGVENNMARKYANMEKAEIQKLQAAERKEAQMVNSAVRVIECEEKLTKANNKVADAREKLEEMKRSGEYDKSELLEREKAIEALEKAILKAEHQTLKTKMTIRKSQ